MLKNRERENISFEFTRTKRKRREIHIFCTNLHNKQFQYSIELNY